MAMAMSSCSVLPAGDRHAVRKPCGLPCGWRVAQNGSMKTEFSAVICTRNRPESLVAAVRSLLQDAAENFDLTVVDQSDGTETEAALASIRADSRLRYYRSQRRGKGAALNEGLALARGTVVACTDDDCLAPPGWVEAMTHTLRSQPNTAVVFCRVLPVPHDQSAGFVPTYEIAASRRLQSVKDASRGIGIGAGMAVDREIVAAMGGFDEFIGPGGRVPAGDDWDIAMRALLMGHAVYETAAISIVHDGFRTFAEGRAHARRDWQGIGTVFAKPLRAGHWKAVVVPARLFSVHAVWPVVLDVLSLRKPRGVGRITAFVRGFIVGLSTPVDKETLRFVEKRRETSHS